jgi:hypothetical protein
LKDNVSAYLRNKIGVKTKERVYIKDSIFGAESVLNSKDTFEFEEHCAKITTLPGAWNRKLPVLYSDRCKSNICSLTMSDKTLISAGVDCGFQLTYKKYFLNFIKSSLSKPPHITSTDGQYSVPKKKKEIAKKPAQKKRPVNAKTSKRH